MKSQHGKGQPPKTPQRQPQPQPQPQPHPSTPAKLVNWHAANKDFILEQFEKKENKNVMNRLGINVDATLSLPELRKFADKYLTTHNMTIKNKIMKNALCVKTEPTVGEIIQQELFNKQPSEIATVAAVQSSPTQHKTERVDNDDDDDSKIPAVVASTGLDRNRNSVVGTRAIGTIKEGDEYENVESGTVEKPAARAAKPAPKVRKARRVATAAVPENQQEEHPTNDTELNQPPASRTRQRLARK